MLSANGMEICIYDTKVRQDDLTRKYLGNAVANVFFYHGTVVKVSIVAIWVRMTQSAK